MTSQPNLRVRISADLAEIKQGLGLLRGDLASLKKQAAAAMPNLGSNAAVAGVRRLRQEVMGLAGAYLSLRGVGLLSGIADEASLIRGRVKAAKGDYEALLQLAQETRSGLAGTIDLYARMERSTRNQEIGQARLLKVTRAVNQAVKLSYADQSAGDAAVMQLGQALASGTLRGEELNSVMEQTPRLAEAIANGMGKPLGALRALAKEGKVTSEAVIKAIEDQADVIEREYAQVPVTIKDALTQIRNSFVDYIGDQDEATGASKRFSSTLQEVARDLPRYLDPLLTMLRLILENLDTLAVFMITRFAAAAIPAMAVGITRLITLLRAATTATITLRAAMMALGGPVGIAVAALATGVYALYRRTGEAEKVQREHNKAIAEFNRLSGLSKQAAREYAEEQRKLALSTLAAARAQVEQMRATAVSGMGGVVGSAGAPAAALQGLSSAQKKLQAAQAAADEWAKKLVQLALEANEVWDEAATPDPKDIEEPGKKLAASNALMRDSVARALAEMDRLYKGHEVGIREYFAARQELQERAIDLQIEQARNELAITKDVGKRRDLEEQIAILMRDRAEVAVAAARDQKEAEEDLTKQLGEVKLALLELDGETGRVARARLEEEYRELFKRLEAASDETGKAMVRNLVDRLVRKAQTDAIRERASDITSRLQSEEGSVSAQIEAGMLGFVEGQERLRQARMAALEQLGEQIRLQREAMAMMEPGSAEHSAALQGLHELQTGYANIAASADVFRNQVKDVATDAVTGFFMDLVEGTKSAGEALRDFVRSFALGMAQIAARALATYLVLQMLDAVYPGLGKATAAMMGAGQNHTGGTAGQVGGVRRWIPEAMLGVAPRYHNGGIAGAPPLKHNEVVSVLERGETIRTQQQERALQAQLDAGSGRVTVKQPIVAIGDRAVADALAGAAGEDVVLTHVRNNWRALSSGT